MLNQNQKKMQMNRTLAIVLSLLVVTAIVVTVVAVVAGKRSKPEADTTVSTLPVITRPIPTEPPATVAPKPSEPIIAEKPVFVSPVTEGNILNAWSGDIPVFSNTMEDYRLHLGVDIEGPAGAPVYAAADGVIEIAEVHPLMGQTVVISHKGGYKTVYKNLQTALPEGIEKGVQVKAGDEIGFIGDSALLEISEPAHLHFEMLKDGVSENPLSHITVNAVKPETDYED